MGLLKPRTTSVVIYQGDDLEHLAELHRAAMRAEAAAASAAKEPLRGGDEIPSARAEQDAYDAFVDEAAERAVVVTLTAIGRTRWRDLLAKHPARTVEVDGKAETIEEDRIYEVNTETFPMALLSYAHDGVRTASLDPEVSESAMLTFLGDEVSDADFEQLWQTAYWLNRAQGSDPKDSKFSTGSQRSDEN